MTKTVKVRWTGLANVDPEQITQYGVTFPSGKWVDVDHDPENKEHVRRMEKFKGMGKGGFEVMGDKPVDPADHPFSTENYVAPVGIARAPLTKYSVVGNKKTGFSVVSEDSSEAADETIYDTQDSAETVAKAKNLAAANPSSPDLQAIERNRK